MPLPANVTTVTVLGTFLTPEGDPSTGTVSFTPSSWLTNSGANVAIPNSSVVKTLGTAGNFSAVLPITDDPDLSPGGWVYGVSEVVDGVSQSYNILIPGTVAVGGTVFLADLVPAAPAGPEYYSLASSLAIGTVTTVAPGGTATATITGLAPNQVLSLGLVRGDTGALTTSGSGSVGTAAVSPAGDPDTGIYYPAANQVAITTGGTAAAIFAAGAISSPTFTGAATFAAGTVSAPAITTTGDTNTGIFFPAPDTVSIAEGGVEVLRVNSSSQVEFPDGSAAAPAITNIGDTNTGLHFPAADQLGIAVGGATALTVSTAATVAIGTATGTGTGRLNIYDATTSQIWVQGDAATSFLIQRSSTDGSSGLIQMDKARGTTASRAIVASADVLGQINFRGFDGSALQNAARIQASVDATPGAGDMPGALQFLTTADGGTTLTERMRIDNAGLFTGTGTSLGAWTAYTPTLAGTGWAIGNGTITGAYCQIGKVVVMRVEITFGSTSTFDATNAPTISLPVTAGTGMAQVGTFVTHAFDLSAAAWYLIRARGATATTVTLQSLGVAGLLANVTSTSPFTWATSDVIRLSGVYQAA